MKIFQEDVNMNILASKGCLHIDGHKELTKESKDPELFTFEGILGLNCGNYIKDML